MIRVQRPKMTDEGWRKWSAEAQQALAELRRTYRPGALVVLREELYQRAKPFLLTLTHDKCAYCESVITNAQPGDVEHYRPKGRIKELDGRVVKMKDGDREFDHPGYWWLCYDWENLLPACIDCNRRRYHDDDPTPVGKAELFPIAGTRAETPDHVLEKELALLLDPSDPKFDPSEHFECCPNGRITPKTKEGSTSCELFGLNRREKLVEQRAQAYLQAKLLLGQWWMMVVTSDGGPPSAQETKLRTLVNEMWEGHTEYSAFARRALMDAQASYKARKATIEFPL